MRSGGRRSSLPCEELAGSVPNRLNPHLCILPVLLPLHSISCIPSPQYSHTELLSGGQEPKQVAESGLSSARGFVQAIAITKEDVMTLQSYRKSPPIAASSRCSRYCTCYTANGGFVVYCFIASIISKSLRPKVLRFFLQYLIKLLLPSDQEYETYIFRILIKQGSYLFPVDQKS